MWYMDAWIRVGPCAWVGPCVGPPNAITGVIIIHAV